MNRLPALALLVLFACATQTTPKPVPASEPNALAARTAKLQRLDGFVPLYWDAAQGKLLMEISRWGEELIYQVSLPAGVGSNPLGLDRGELGATHLVRFDRVGPRVLMVQLNTRYRAISDDPNERRAVEDSFAQSILAGFKVEASDGETALVDATDFFLSDAHGVARRLRQEKQGDYKLDRERSAIHLPRTKAFPRNTEVEAILTFTTNDQPGALVSGVTPVPEVVTVREHHSLVALPEPGYKPRRIDPRVGMFGIEVYDYASPFAGPIEKRWVSRHRLEKKDPAAAVSEPVKPIVYYVDNGVPEPIRSALIEGASWWGQAFEAAGFRNAFIVKVLPDGADPMDVRYNMINWVHRSTRGWSYGETVTDPRTGEIIKGNVRLGSLRIRQDALIAGGLIPQFDELHDEALSALDPKTSPSLMAATSLLSKGRNSLESRRWRIDIGCRARCRRRHARLGRGGALPPRMLAGIRGVDCERRRAAPPTVDRRGGESRLRARRVECGVQESCTGGGAHEHVRRVGKSFRAAQERRAVRRVSLGRHRLPGANCGGKAR